jgi:hypothetical protein
MAGVENKDVCIIKQEENKNLTDDEKILKFMNIYKDKINWNHMTYNKCIKLDMIMNNPELPWDWEAVSCRIGNLYNDLYNDLYRKTYKDSQNKFVNFITTYKDKLNWTFLSKNINIDIVINNPELPWNWQIVSGNEYLNIDMVLNNPELPWDLQMLSGKMDDLLYNMNYNL